MIPALEFVLFYTSADSKKVIGLFDDRMRALTVARDEMVRLLKPGQVVLENIDEEGVCRGYILIRAEGVMAVLTHLDRSRREIGNVRHMHPAGSISAVTVVACPKNIVVSF